MNRGRLSTLGGGPQELLSSMPPSGRVSGTAKVALHDIDDVSGKASKEAQPMGRWKWLVVLALAACVIVLSTRFTGLEDVLGLLEYVKTNRNQLMVVFILVNAISVVLAVPPSLLQTLAGAVYGNVMLGACIGFIGTFSGQCLAFSLGRYLFRDSMAAWLARKVPVWSTIENALFMQGGIRLVLLLRLSPVMPDSVLNYALSTTPVSLGVFASATALAMIPWSLLYAYLGSTSSDIAKTIKGGGAADDDTPGLKIGIAVVSLVMVCIMVLYVGIMLKRILAQAAQSAGPADEASDDDEMETGNSSSRQPLLSAAVERQSTPAIMTAQSATQWSVGGMSPRAVTPQ